MPRPRLVLVFSFIAFRLAAQSSPDFFESKIRPVLAANCFSCHASAVHLSGLDLSTAAGFAKGGERGALIDRSSPEKSRLVQAIGYSGDLKMPPSGKLPAEQIRDLTAWVGAGAPWPAGPVAAQPAPAVSGYKFTREQKAFWAWQPIRHPEPPVVKNEAWVKSPVDRFILSELEKKALAPAPPAGKAELLRRVTYDLTGLPPTRQEVERFLSDRSADAYAKVVDRLLASPRYGEQWGRHWLDVARYADSAGDDDDNLYPYAYRYRDWVIGAFNSDMPFDRMVRLQIAGDLLPPDKPEGVNTEGIVATGFIALGQKPLTEQNKPMMLYDIADEQLDTTGRALMGLTLGCARCHDHKFDPIPTADYYSMASIFHDTRTIDVVDKLVSTVLFEPLAPKDVAARYRRQQDRVKSKSLEIEAAVEESDEGRTRELISRTVEYMMAAGKDAKPAGLDPRRLELWTQYLKPTGDVRPHLERWYAAVATGRPESVEQAAREYRQALEARAAEWWRTLEDWRAAVRSAAAKEELPPEQPKFEGGSDRFFFETCLEKGPFAPEKGAPLGSELEARVAPLRAQLETLQKALPPELPMACGVEEGRRSQPRVLIRGNVASPGEAVPKQFLRIIAGERQKPIENGSGRLELAQWLTSPDHPLVARVIANRIWQYHFGEGIVRTPNNFGRTGEAPTHPELLDYLARRFMESGWSFKAMHRLLLLSNAYQMSSQVSRQAHELDPGNRLFSRAARRRLAFEEIRDTLLSLSGDLDLTMGGPPDSGKGVDWRKSGAYFSANKEPEASVRRSIYLPVRRSRIPSVLTLFDFGDATTPGEGRAATNTAPQALFLMNSPYVTERSRAIAEKLASEAGDARRASAAYLSIAGKPPDPAQIREAAGYISELKARRVEGPAAWQSFCRALLLSNAFLYVD